MRKLKSMSWKNRAMALLTFCALCPAGAADWPQFRGPNHDGTTAEKILRAWPKEGPPVRWQRKIGAGFSGPVVAKEKLILFHRVGDKETVECLGARDGIHTG